MGQCPRDKAQQAISESEKIARIRLYRSENVGPITFYQLLTRYKTAEKALLMLPELARRGGRLDPVRLCPEEEALKEIEHNHKHNAQLIVWGEPQYPLSLFKMSDATPVLSIKGDASLCDRKTIALVGARNCSLVGKKIATSLAQELGEYGYVIASGLARGIDTCAHQGSLTTGTIAVIAGGIDKIYPPENEKLYHAICEKGLLIAESPFGMEPQANLFPRRNRLISGLSLGVVLVEAAVQSGSLITARYANEQGKEVFVVPGSPLDPRYKGSNHLLKQGATLVTSSTDVMDVLERPYIIPQTKPMQQLFEEDIDEDFHETSAQVLNLLSATAISLDELMRVCRLSSTQVLSVLLQLELAGKITRQPGNYIARTA